MEKNRRPIGVALLDVIIECINIFFSKCWKTGAWNRNTKAEAEIKAKSEKAGKNVLSKTEDDEKMRHFS